MITCPSCGTPSQEGNFCGKCGNSLKQNNPKTPQLEEEKFFPEEKFSQEEIPPFQPTQKNTPPEQSNLQKVASSETVKNLKKQGGNYWNYFIQSLKNPSKMGSESNFTFAWITTIISLVLYTLIPIVLTNSMLSNLYSFSSLQSHKIGLGTFITIFIYFSIFYCGLVSLILLLSKKLGTMTSWKQGISQIGAYNNLVNVAFLFILLLLLINSIGFATILYSFIATLFVAIVPLFTATFFFINSKKLDPFINYLITIFVSVIFVIIYCAIFLDKIANSINISSLLQPFNL